jgi:hypothetical protein
LPAAIIIKQIGAMQGGSMQVTGDFPNSSAWDSAIVQGNLKMIKVMQKSLF